MRIADKAQAPKLDDYKALFDHGVAIHLCKPRSKEPLKAYLDRSDGGWQKMPRPTWDLLTADYRPGMNFGARFGRWSRIADQDGDYYLHGVDFDLKDPSKKAEAYAALAEVLPGYADLPQGPSGSRNGSMRFYVGAREPLKTRFLRKSKEFLPGTKKLAWEIELFGDTLQMVIEGSIHPSGHTYADTGLASFIAMGCLPILTPEQTAKWPSGKDQESFVWTGGAVSPDAQALYDALPETLQAKLDEEPVKGTRGNWSFHVSNLLFNLGLTHEQIFVLAMTRPYAVKFNTAPAYRREKRVKDEIIRCYGAWSDTDFEDLGADESSPLLPADFDLPVSDPKAGTKPAEAAKPSRIFKIGDLKNKVFEPHRFVAEGLISEGTTLLGGRPKAGKSWLAFDLARAVATGGVVLGRKCDRGNVLYLALEDTQRRLKSRFEKLAASDDDWSGDLQLATEWPKGKDAIVVFRKWMVSVPKPRLIIVDTLAKVKDAPKGGKESYSSDYEAIALFQEFSKTTGVSILMVTHTRKSDADDAFDTLTGTLGNNAAANSLMVMRRQDKTGQMILYGKGRDLDEYELPISFDKDTARWSISGEFEDLSLTPTKREIINAVRNSGSASPAEIRDQTGLNHETIKTTLRRAVDDGLLRKIGKGEYSIIDGFDDPSTFH